MKKLFKSFKVSVQDMFRQMHDGELQFVASALAFSTLLSMVPFLAVTLSIFKTIGGLEFMYPKVESLVLSYFQEAAGRQAMDVIRKILQRLSSDLLGTTGVLALFFTSAKLIQDMEKGINRVWNVKETRPIHRRLALNMAIFFLVPFCLAIYGGFRSVSLFVPFFKSDFRNLADFLILSFGLFLTYKFVPYIKVNTRPALVSALLVGGLLLGLKFSFAWAATRVFTFSKVYGGLAAAPLLCLWILGNWYLILGGVAFCASSQKRRWLDETYGFDFKT